MPHKIDHEKIARHVRSKHRRDWWSFVLFVLLVLFCVAARVVMDIESEPRHPVKPVPMATSPRQHAAP